MEEIITKGVVVKSTDYKEKDKLVEIFSPEFGKMFCSLKGCASPTAKLKFAYQPFCFAEFCLVKYGEHFTIKNATLLDSFFEITNDIENYYVSSLMLELSSYLSEQEINSQVFVLLLQCLKNIAYDGANCKIIAIKFCEEVLSLLGYNLNFKNCAVCKMNFTSGVFLNLESGEFVCKNCAHNLVVRVSNAVFSAIRIINDSELDKVKNIKLTDEISNEALKILCENLERRLMRQIKSKKFI